MSYDPKRSRAEAREKRRQVYALVKKKQPIGVTDISRATDLDPTTVGFICREFLDEEVFRQLADRRYALRAWLPSMDIKQAVNEANFAFLGFVKGFWDSRKGYSKVIGTEDG